MQKFQVAKTWSWCIDGSAADWRPQGPSPDCCFTLWFAPPNPGWARGHAKDVDQWNWTMEVHFLSCWTILTDWCLQDVLTCFNRLMFQDNVKWIHITDNVLHNVLICNHTWGWWSNWPDICWRWVSSCDSHHLHRTACTCLKAHSGLPFPSAQSWLSIVYPTTSHLYHGNTQYWEDK